MLKPLPGLDDRFGEDLSVRRFVESATRELFPKWGYQEYEPPLIERIQTFSEDVTGPSPWPNFSEKEFILAEVPMYSGGDVVDRTLCLLRPEGTASLCRALARRVRDEGLKKVLSDSLRFYYAMNCYRNEPLEALTATKKREFGQVGLELMGFKNPGADVEAIYLANALMEKIGVPRTDISVRLSDVNIFRNLSKMSDLPVNVMTEIKTRMDNLSKARMYKDEPQAAQLQKEISRILDKSGIKGPLRDTWGLVCSETGSENLVYGLSQKLQNDTTWAKNLGLIVSELGELGINTIFDPAVIRGWAYYTGPVFQIDVTGKKGIFPERAGGGRYDTLAGSFLRKYGLKGQIPATGFAFGTERLEELVRAYGVPSGKERFELYMDTKPEVVIGDDYASEFPGQTIKRARATQTLTESGNRTAIYWGPLASAGQYAERIGAKRLYASDELGSWEEELGYDEFVHGELK